MSKYNNKRGGLQRRSPPGVQHVLHTSDGEVIIKLDKGRKITFVAPAVIKIVTIPVDKTPT